MSWRKDPPPARGIMAIQIWLLRVCGMHLLDLRKLVPFPSRRLNSCRSRLHCTPPGSQPMTQWRPSSTSPACTNELHRSR
uniref:Uncharacterized protein n=1 Tax=Arundo donax TaxID=35708 RepID=A0A0A9BK37_ARUDO